MDLNEIPTRVKCLRGVDSVPPVVVDWLWFDRLGCLDIPFRFPQQSLVLTREMAPHWARPSEFVRNLYQLRCGIAQNIGRSVVFECEGFDHQRHGTDLFFLSLMPTQIISVPGKAGSA